MIKIKINELDKFKFDLKKNIFLLSSFEKIYKFNKNFNEEIYVIGIINYYFYKNKIFNFSPKSKIQSDINNKIEGLNLEEIRNFFNGKFILIHTKDKFIKNIFSDLNSEKQIYYFKEKNQIIVSDNLQNFKKEKNLSYNQNAIAGVIGNFGNYAFDKTTIYGHIKKIGVNEFLNFENKKLNIKKFNLNLEEIKYDLNEKNFKDFFELNCELIKARVSKKTNWIYLSSGYDSSFILGMLNYLIGSKKIRAITGKLKYSNKTGVCNKFEIERTKKLADYYKIKLDIVDIDYTNSIFLDQYEENKEILRENHIYALYANNFLTLAKFAKTNSEADSTIFNGDISDGVQNFGFSQFATLLTFEDINFREYADKMMCYLYSPVFFKKILNKEYSKDPIFNFLKKEKKILISEKTNIKFKYLASLFLSSSRFPLTQIVNDDLINKNKKNYFENYLLRDLFADIVKNVTEKNLYSSFIELYKKFHWNSGTVRGIIGASEFFNIRSSTPFFDSQLIDFFKKLPPKYGRDLSLNETKYSIKWILKNKIDYPLHLQIGPHSYNYDVDPSWSADQELLYESKLTNVFKKQLKTKNYKDIIDNSLINLKYLDKLSNSYIEGKKLSGEKLAHLKGLISLVNIGWY